METKPDVTPFFLDKGIWLLILTPLIAFLNAKFNLGISAEAIIAMALPVVAYIVGHKWKTATLQKARIEAPPAPGLAGVISLKKVDE